MSVGIHHETPLIESLALSRGLAGRVWLKMEALQPCGSFKAPEISRTFEVVPHVVSDRQAVEACLSFADDHRVVVEPACGAALSLVYQNVAALQTAENILLIVCGGVG